jgi:hypothetical protein
VNSQPKIYPPAWLLALCTVVLTAATIDHGIRFYHDHSTAAAVMMALFGFVAAVNAHGLLEIWRGPRKPGPAADSNPLAGRDC